MEKFEDTHAALVRELLEEVGCQARVIREVGQIVEYKNEHQEKQISYCWLTRQVGQMVDTSFTEEELKDGFQVVWVDGIAGAIDLLIHDEPINYTGKFIQQRDLRFLEVAKTLL